MSPLSSSFRGTAIFFALLSTLSFAIVATRQAQAVTVRSSASNSQLFSGDLVADSFNDDGFEVNPSPSALQPAPLTHVAKPAQTPAQQPNNKAAASQDKPAAPAATNAATPAAAVAAPAANDKKNKPATAEGELRGANVNVKAVAVSAAPSVKPATLVDSHLLNALQLHVPVWWYAPFFSGGGYCSEAISFVGMLTSYTNVHIAQHGDGFNKNFMNGLEHDTRDLLERLSATQIRANESVSICHSTPRTWNDPQAMNPCPPTEGSLFKVGRTMFETDRLPDGWAARMKDMDEIWVPTAFHKTVFAKWGVAASKLRVIKEAVDGEMFNPDKVVKPYDLPKADPATYKFISVFKWEERKGWRFLVEAYLRAFNGTTDKVALYILTHPYEGGANHFDQLILGLMKELKIDITPHLPHIYVIADSIPNRQMPGFYKAGNCFVLPTRGEGWGRPAVEAMAMGLPVISTAWSGPSEYLNELNGYPLNIDGLETIPDGPWKGHQWAKPSVKHLIELMQRVYKNQQEAKQRGQRAREDMINYYCPDCIARSVVQELVRIEQEIKAKKK